MPRRQRRTYTPEQRADAVRMVHEVGNLAKVARDLDLTESALRNWVSQAKTDEGQGPEGALTSDEREELRRLRRDNRALQMERDFLKKSRGLLRQGPGPACALMLVERSNFPVALMCRVLGVSRSGWYAWRKGPLSPLQGLKVSQRAEVLESHRELPGSTDPPPW